MNKPKKNIAIVTQSDNAYSETFIQAHKNYLHGNIFYYYKNGLELEGNSIITKKSRIRYAVNSKVFRSSDDLKQLALIDSFKKNRIEYVLAEYGPTGVMMLDVCKKLNLPLMVHFHGYDASVRSVLKRYEKKYKEMFSYADNIIAVSEVMKKKLIETGCPENKLTLNHYGPNDIFYGVKPNYSSKKVICIGRLVDKKSPLHSIMAFEEVLKVQPDASLTFIGDGPLMNSTKNYVHSKTLQNSIHFAGVVKPEELINYMNNAQLYIQHSITADDGNMEGTPNSILEAAAAALPIVSTKHAGIPDVVSDGETGILVEEKDIHNMANGIIKILADPKLAQNMGEMGRERIKEKFTRERHIQCLNELIYA